jgi:phage FluMu protein Com
MAIHSFAPREFQPPKKWGGKHIKTLTCFHCERGILCRHVIRIGYLEIQCPSCGGIIVIKNGESSRNRPRPHVHTADGQPVRAE